MLKEKKAYLKKEYLFISLYLLFSHHFFNEQNLINSNFWQRSSNGNMLMGTYVVAFDWSFFLSNTTKSFSKFKYVLNVFMADFLNKNGSTGSTMSVTVSITLYYDHHLSLSSKCFSLTFILSLTWFGNDSKNFHLISSRSTIVSPPKSGTNMFSFLLTH